MYIMRNNIWAIEKLDFVLEKLKVIANKEKEGKKNYLAYVAYRVLW